MKRSTAGVPRRPFAAATATIKTTNPIGNSHSRLNHLLRPTCTRGAMPCAWGTEPAQVVGSTTSSPVVSCDRKLRTDSGDSREDAGAGRSSGGGRSTRSDIDLNSCTCVPVEQHAVRGRSTRNCPDRSKRGRRTVAAQG